MTVTLVPRARPDVFRLNNVQVALLAGALLAVGAPDRDLLAPGAYLPSQVCASWSDLLFPALSDLVLVEVWDPGRSRLRPRAVLRVPVPPPRGQRRAPPVPPGPVLPLLHERTAVMHTPLGPVLLALAGWLGSCGGCTVQPGRPRLLP